MASSDRDDRIGVSLVRDSETRIQTDVFVQSIGSRIRSMCCGMIEYQFNMKLLTDASGGIKGGQDILSWYVSIPYRTIYLGTMGLLK